MYRPNEQDSGVSLSRILLVIGISIAFFAVYAYLFPQNQTQTSKDSQAKQISIESKLDSANAAPQTAESTIIDNPAGQTSTTSKIPLKDTIITTIRANEFDLEIDALGRINQVYLKDKRYLSNSYNSLFNLLFGSKPQELDRLPVFGDDLLHTLEIRFKDSALNSKAFSTPYTSNIVESKLDSAPQIILLKQDLGEVIIEKKITLYENLSYDIDISINNPNVEYFISNGMRPYADSDTYAFRGVIVRDKHSDSLVKYEDGDASREYIAKKANEIKSAGVIASVDRYFTSLFFSKDKPFYAVLSGDSASNPEPFIRLSGDASFGGYIGAKEHHLLSSINEDLVDIVEYGVITFFAKPLFLLLDYLYSLCGNWGWAIVLLTLIVRVILYPLTYKGMVSMQKLKDLAPKMKEIQAKYKNDPQKLQIHMMDLYKKNGANPLGGCLPLILQIPVFFAIYRVLHNAVELKSSEWILWINDLSAIDPFFVLPLLMGISMYVSQHLTPSNFTDPMQEKVFKMLPIFFTIFFIVFPFPAGLVLYWTTNNIFSIIQQLSINKIMATKKLQSQQEQSKHKKGDKL